MLNTDFLDGALRELRAAHRRLSSPMPLLPSFRIEPNANPWLLTLHSASPTDQPIVFRPIDKPRIASGVLPSFGFAEPLRGVELQFEVAGWAPEEFSGFVIGQSRRDRFRLRNATLKRKRESQYGFELRFVAFVDSNGNSPLIYTANYQPAAG